MESSIILTNDMLVISNTSGCCLVTFVKYLKGLISLIGEVLIAKLLEHAPSKALIAQLLEHNLVKL